MEVGQDVPTRAGLSSHVGISLGLGYNWSLVEFFSPVSPFCIMRRFYVVCLEPDLPPLEEILLRWKGCDPDMFL